MQKKNLNMSDVDSSGKFHIFSILNINLEIFISAFYLPGCFGAFDFPSPGKQEEEKGNTIHSHRFCCLVMVLINDQGSCHNWVKSISGNF